MTSAAAKLNLGCGGAFRSGFVNVDRDSISAADVRADAALLPFRDEHFDRIECIHLLEHLGFTEALRVVAEAYRVLRPEGVLVIETPDPEQSFAAFVREPSRPRRAQLLSWIFGLDAPGFHHRLLYPGELLERTLLRAGFETLRVAPPRYHVYAPGQRVVCRRMGGPIHAVLAHLRRQLAVDGLLDLSHQLVAFDFEEQLVSALLRLGGEGEPLAEALETALEAMLVSPLAARSWLALFDAHGLAVPGEAGQLARVATAAHEAHLSARLLAELERPGPHGATGFETLRSRGLAVLHRAFEAHSGQELAAVFEGTASPGADADRVRRVPLVPAAVESHVAAMVGRGLRLAYRGRSAEGILLLERAAATGVSPLYTIWNLAVLHAAAGRLDEAVRRYEEALVLGFDALRPALLGELSVCYLHAGHPGQAKQVALQLPAGPQREALVSRGDDGPLPELRRTPVIPGEGWHHVLEP